MRRSRFIEVLPRASTTPYSTARVFVRGILSPGTPGPRGKSEEDLLNLTQLAIDYYLAKDSAPSGKRIVGDKSPLHTDHVDEIFDFYPEARVIHIVRDGRDVAVSLMHHFWRLAKDKGGIFDLDPEELANVMPILKTQRAFWDQTTASSQKCDCARWQYAGVGE